MGLFSKKVTVGYRYKLGMHMIFCHGPIDGVLQFWVGDKQIWPESRSWYAKANNYGNGTITGVSTVAGSPVEEWTLTCSSAGPHAVFSVVGSVSGAKANATSGVAYNNGLVAFTITDGSKEWRNLGILDPLGIFSDRLYVTGGVSSGMARDGETQATIDQDNIFGGNSSEGGISGTVDIEYGTSVQTANTYLQGILGTDIPAFRRLCGLVLRQVYLGTQPYIKPWSILAKRTELLTSGNAQWYPAKATIGTYDMNPAHLIRECLTDGSWGKGFDATYIDGTSFEATADTLYAEGFGLSFLWDKQDTINALIGDVLHHIDGYLYQDLATGKFVLSLARDDYVVGDLDSYNASQINSISDFVRPAIGSIVDQVTVNYHDRLNDEPASLTVQDIAMISRQGGKVIAENLSFPAICEADLANKVAQRELHQFTSALASMTIKGNRAMSMIQPNGVFKITWPPLNITDMVVRAISVNRGTLEDGTVTIKATEDIYAMGTAVFGTPAATSWTTPSNYPENPDYTILVETPYLALVRDLFGDSLTPSLAAGAGYLLVGSVPPTGDSYAFELQCRDSDSDTWRSEGIKAWTPSATIAANLPEDIADVSVTLANVSALESVEVDTWALIGDECVKVKTVSTTTNTVTLARAVLDTVPAAHVTGDRIWFLGSEACTVDREYTNGDTPRARVLTMSALGTLADDEGEEETATAFGSRAYRPYPPSDVKVNGSSYPASFTGDLAITWKHRDRTQQTGTDILEQTDAGVGPEAGTTYVVKIYNQSDVLIHTETGLSGTSYTYTDAQERADCGFGPGDPLNTTLRFVLYSIRAGYASFQSHDIFTDRIQASASVSASLSSSPSASTSPTPSSSPSASVSATPSASVSTTPSASPSASVSGSPSTSPSASVSPSAPLGVWAEVRPAGDMDRNWWTVAADGDGSHFAAGVYNGRLYTSPDEGANWSERQPKGAANGNWYNVDLDDSGDAVVVGDLGGRLYTSPDNGLNWTERQPAGSVDAAWAVARSDSDGTALLAAILGGRAYTTSNSGASWAETQPGGDVDLSHRCGASDTDGSNLILGVAGGRLYTSSNSGSSWTERQPAGNFNKDWRCVASDTDGSHLVAAVHGGRVYVSTDSGATWSETLPAGSNDGAWTSVAIDQTGLIMMICEDNGRIWRTIDGGTLWHEETPDGAVDRRWWAIDMSNEGDRAIAAVYGGRVYVAVIVVPSSSPSASVSTSLSTSPSVSVSSSISASPSASPSTSPSPSSTPSTSPSSTPSASISASPSSPIAAGYAWNIGAFQSDYAEADSYHWNIGVDQSDDWPSRSRSSSISASPSVTPSASISASPSSSPSPSSSVSASPSSTPSPTPSFPAATSYAYNIGACQSDNPDGTYVWNIGADQSDPVSSPSSSPSASPSVSDSTSPSSSPSA